MVKLLIILALAACNLSQAPAQGRLSVGFDLASRKEIRHYHDPQGYLHRRYTPLFAIGGSILYSINDKWEIESGIYETSFHETISVYYKEPGYTLLANTGWQVGGMRTLQIPLRGVYDIGLGWKSISFRAVGGINLYNLTLNLNSRGEAGLSPIPVSPSPPTNLRLYYESYPLRKNSLALEGGGEVRLPISSRLFFIYRFTILAGTRDMARMEGYYEIDQPLTRYPFEVTSRGSARHHTFSLRYRFGKKKEIENRWQMEE